MNTLVDEIRKTLIEAGFTEAKTRRAGFKLSEYNEYGVTHVMVWPSNKKITWNRMTTTLTSYNNVLHNSFDVRQMDKLILVGRKVIIEQKG